jgi:alpha-tubulin suppressor-like RCC1 family protein
MALALGWWASACSETIPSQVILQLYVEPDLATTATTMTLSIENDEGDMVLKEDKPLDGSSGRIARIPLIPKGDDPTRRYIVRAELSDGVNVLGRIEARAGYRDGELRTLNLWFTSECSSATDCGDGRTCQNGTCRGACFETSPADATEPSRPSCKECEKCLVACEPTDGEPCGCDGDVCVGNECKPRDEVRFVGAAWEHTCAVLGIGTVHCWGTTDGFGAGWTSPQPVPVGMDGTLGISLQIHGCALSTGSIQCWGSNSSGQLGDGPSSPVTVANSSAFDMIEAGKHHTCALDHGGGVHCWGANNLGQLGNGTTNTAGTPTPTPQLVGTGYTRFSSGADQNCALDGSGTLFCWGNNEAGQAGFEPRFAITTPQPAGCYDPTSPTCFHDWVHVGTGDWVTCGIRQNGQLYCWGANTYGGRGTGPPYGNNEVSDPMRVGPGIQWADVQGGYRHTCGLDMNDKLYCWGSNDKRQVLPIDESFIGTPVQIETDEPLGFTAVAAGRTHTCAIRADRTLWCWGGNDFGQIGAGQPSATPVPRPTRVCFPAP